VSNRCPEYSAGYRTVAELKKLLFVFRIIRKKDSDFFAASTELRIETTDFYLRARKMA
jgi:hypothetical protein